MLIVQDNRGFYTAALTESGQVQNKRHVSTSCSPNQMLLFSSNNSLIAIMMLIKFYKLEEKYWNMPESLYD